MMLLYVVVLGVPHTASIWGLGHLWNEVIYQYLLTPAALVSYSHITWCFTVIMGVYSDRLDDVAVGYRVGKACCGPYIGFGDIWNEVIHHWLYTTSALISCYNHKYDSTVVICMYSDVLDKVAVDYHVNISCCGLYIEICVLYKVR
jgi:hypothetical protein